MKGTTQSDFSVIGNNPRSFVFRLFEKTFRRQLDDFGRCRLQGGSDRQLLLPPGTLQAEIHFPASLIC